MELGLIWGVGIKGRVTVTVRSRVKDDRMRVRVKLTDRDDLLHVTE